jgi:hypothetical protein
MSSPPQKRQPRFKVGDRIVVVGPGNAKRGERGVVVEILEPFEVSVYRFVVQFGDGTTDRFFSFDLQPADQS